METTSIRRKGKEQVSADISGFLQVKEEEWGPGVLSMPEAQGSMGTELPTKVQVPIGTQRTQEVPQKPREADCFKITGSLLPPVELWREPALNGRGGQVLEFQLLLGHS